MASVPFFPTKTENVGTVSSASKLLQHMREVPCWCLAQATTLPFWENKTWGKERKGALSLFHRSSAEQKPHWDTFYALCKNSAQGKPFSHWRYLNPSQHLSNVGHGGNLASNRQGLICNGLRGKQRESLSIFTTWNPQWRQQVVQ